MQAQNMFLFYFRTYLTTILGAAANFTAKIPFIVESLTLHCPGWEGTAHALIFVQQDVHFIVTLTNSRSQWRLVSQHMVRNFCVLHSANRFPLP